jgi:hypothetical protein
VLPSEGEHLVQVALAQVWENLKGFWELGASGLRGSSNRQCSCRCMQLPDNAGATSKLDSTAHTLWWGITNPANGSVLMAVAQ